MSQQLPPDANVEEIRNELFGLAGYRDGARFFSGKADARIEKLTKELQAAMQANQQLQLQVQHGLAFEKEKRSIDQKKMQLAIDEMRMSGNDPRMQLLLQQQEMQIADAEARAKIMRERNESEAKIELMWRELAEELAMERERLASDLQRQREESAAKIAAAKAIAAAKPKQAETNVA
jgi:hypothetical protein